MHCYGAVPPIFLAEVQLHGQVILDQVNVLKNVTRTWVHSASNASGNTSAPFCRGLRRIIRSLFGEGGPTYHTKAFQGLGIGRHHGIRRANVPGRALGKRLRATLMHCFDLLPEIIQGSKIPMLLEGTVHGYHGVRLHIAGSTASHVAPQSSGRELMIFALDFHNVHWR